MVRSHQGHTMMMHTYTPNQCPYQISTSYTLWFLKYSLENHFPAAHPSAHLDTMGENNTHTALKGFVVKIVYALTKKIKYLPKNCLLF